MVNWGDRDKPVSPLNQMRWWKDKRMNEGKICLNPFHKIHRKHSGIWYWSDGKKQKGWDK